MEVFRAVTVPEGQRQVIISALREFLGSKEEIIFCYLFGSFADKDVLFFRDIDVAVYVKDEILATKNSLDYSIDLSLELERLVSEYPVDVVVLNNASLPVAFHVTEGILLFSRDEDLWTDFVTKTWALYHEHSITSRYVLDDLVSV